MTSEAGRRAASAGAATAARQRGVVSPRARRERSCILGRTVR